MDQPSTPSMAPKPWNFLRDGIMSVSCPHFWTMHRARDPWMPPRGGGWFQETRSVVTGLEPSHPFQPPELRVGEGESITEAEEPVSHPGKQGS